MGFKLNINNILRQDIKEPLKVGQILKFEKKGFAIIADDIQIWLTKKDWTVLADIQITSQKREDDKTTGMYEVKYVYEGEEQRVLTDIFIRMYGWR